MAEMSFNGEIHIAEGHKLEDLNLIPLRYGKTLYVIYISSKVVSELRNIGVVSH